MEEEAASDEADDIDIASVFPTGGTTTTKKKTSSKKSTSSSLSASQKDYVNVNIGNKMAYLLESPFRGTVRILLKDKK